MLLAILIKIFTFNNAKVLLFLLHSLDLPFNFAFISLGRINNRWSGFIQFNESTLSMHETRTPSIELNE